MKDIKDRLVSLAKEYQEIEKDAGLCGIGEDYVHLLKESFEKLFPKEDVKYYINEETNFFAKYAKYDGMNFVCVLTTEEYENEKV